MQSHPPLQPCKGSTELHPYINLSVLPHSTPLNSQLTCTSCHVREGGLHDDALRAALRASQHGTIQRNCAAVVGSRIYYTRQGANVTSISISVHVTCVRPGVQPNLHHTDLLLTPAAPTAPRLAVPHVASRAQPCSCCCWPWWRLRWWWWCCCCCCCCWSCCCRCPLHRRL